MAEINNPSLRIEDELKKHGTYATNTVGISMRPLFKTHRDAVFLSAPEREIRKYDVVLYTDDTDRYILHRVIGVRDGFFIIRGDNTYMKERVPRERVIAYMVSFTRCGKHHKIEERGYKFYSRFWNFIYPFRWILHKFRSLVRKIIKNKPTKH